MPQRRIGEEGTPGIFPIRRSGDSSGLVVGGDHHECVRVRQRKIERRTGEKIDRKHTVRGAVRIIGMPAPVGIAPLHHQEKSFRIGVEPVAQNGSELRKQFRIAPVIDESEHRPVRRNSPQRFWHGNLHVAGGAELRDQVAFIPTTAAGLFRQKGTSSGSDQSCTPLEVMSAAISCVIFRLGTCARNAAGVAPVSWSEVITPTALPVARASSATLRHRFLSGVMPTMPLQVFRPQASAVPAAAESVTRRSADAVRASPRTETVRRRAVPAPHGHEVRQN